MASGREPDSLTDVTRVVWVASPEKETTGPGPLGERIQGKQDFVRLERSRAKKRNCPCLPRARKQGSGISSARSKVMQRSKLVLVRQSEEASKQDFIRQERSRIKKQTCHRPLEARKQASGTSSARSEVVQRSKLVLVRPERGSKQVGLHPLGAKSRKEANLSLSARSKEASKRDFVCLEQSRAKKQTCPCLPGARKQASGTSSTWREVATKERLVLICPERGSKQAGLRPSGVMSQKG